MNGQGMTLFEVLVVMVIVGILLVIGMLSYRGMQQRYNVEKQAKEIYTDMVNARLRAIQRDRVQFAVFSSVSPTMYRIYEDGPMPNGDGAPNAATDLLITTYVLLPTYSLSLSTNPSMTLIQFSTKGLVDPSDTGPIRITPTAGGEYDCIFVDQIKTSMGKWNDTTNNCDIK